MSGAISAKNATVPGSVSAGLGLGMGDDLQAQVEQQILARRQKSLAVTNQAPVAYGAAGVGVTSQPGGMGMSPAVLSLLGQGGLNA